jgi:hypothetical protein
VEEGRLRRLKMVNSPKKNRVNGPRGGERKKFAWLTEHA